MRHDEPAGAAPLPTAAGPGGTGPGLAPAGRDRGTPADPPAPATAPAAASAPIAPEARHRGVEPAGARRPVRSRAGEAPAAIPNGPAPPDPAIRRESRAEAPGDAPPPGPGRGDGRAAYTPGRRRVARPFLLAAAAVPLAAGTAYVAARLDEPAYAARSEVVFHLRDHGADAAARFLATQALTARSRAVIEPVAARLGIPAGALDERLSVEVLPGSNVMRLEYAHPDRSVALGAVQDVAGRYLTLLRDVELVEEASHRLLTPAFVLDEPVAPRPLQAAALGALVGLAIVAGVLVLAARPA